MSKITIDNEPAEIQDLIVAQDYDATMYYPFILKQNPEADEYWQAKQVGDITNTFEDQLIQIIKQLDRRITELEAQSQSKEEQPEV